DGCGTAEETPEPSPLAVVQPVMPVRHRLDSRPNGLVLRAAGAGPFGSDFRARPAERPYAKRQVASASAPDRPRSTQPEVVFWVARAVASANQPECPAEDRRFRPTFGLAPGDR